MTDENAKKKYKHLSNIIAGKYSTERYNKDDDEINLDKVSNELMVSDAKRHLADLLKKRPYVNFEDKPKEIVLPNTSKEVKESKSKGKK